MICNLKILINWALLSTKISVNYTKILEIYPFSCQNTKMCICGNTICALCFQSAPEIYLLVNFYNSWRIATVVHSDSTYDSLGILMATFTIMNGYNSLVIVMSILTDIDYNSLVIVMDVLTY